MIIITTTTTTIFLGCDSIEIDLVFHNVDLNLPDCHHSHQPEKIMQSCVNIVFKCNPIKWGRVLRGLNNPLVLFFKSFNAIEKKSLSVFWLNLVIRTHTKYNQIHWWAGNCRPGPINIDSPLYK